MSTYIKSRKRLNVKDFQHPADRQAVEAVMAVPCLNKVLEYISKNSLERTYSFINNSCRIKVTKEMSPKIHTMLWEAARMYGADRIPDLYLERNYAYHINLDGMTKPFIVMTTSELEGSDDALLWGYLSSQLAGIQAKHETLEFVDNILNFTKGMLPFGVDAALDLAIKSWKRARSYTADRAILLGTESFALAAKAILHGEVPDAVIDSIGLDKPDNTYYRQATEFLNRSGAGGAIQKLETVSSSGQWMAARYIELYNWYYSGEYYDVLEGSELA